MKRFLKVIGAILVLFVLSGILFYLVKNEALPKGKQGKEADALATNMLHALNADAFENTEIITWSFRNTHHYKWFKSQHRVEVSWGENKVVLDTKNNQNSHAFSAGKKVANTELIATATAFFNNDSFWLVAPYKVFDAGTERRIVSYEDKEALLITYTSGGTTPGDSYLWILDENYLPVSYKMWTKIIPIGGVSATWSDLKMTEAGIKLPTKHKLSLFGMVLSMGEVKAFNPSANELANTLLKAIKHDKYIATNHLEWSFGGRRAYKWNKKDHLVTVLWDSIKVILHTKNTEKSTVYLNDILASEKNEHLILKATRYFNNDSFWLVAPHKLFEKGIIRSIQKEAGKDALLVKYMTGGSTPGDAYLWILDEENVPESYKMFVPSMKMNGVSATWDDWITTESGALLPTNHSFGNGGKLSMGEVKGTK